MFGKSAAKHSACQGSKDREKSELVLRVRATSGMIDMAHHLCRAKEKGAKNVPLEVLDVACRWLMLVWCWGGIVEGKNGGM